VQHAAKSIDDLEPLGLADDRLLDLQPARTVTQVDGPDPEGPSVLAGDEKALPIERRARDAAGRDRPLQYADRFQGRRVRR